MENRFLSKSIPIISLLIILLLLYSPAIAQNEVQDSDSDGMPDTWENTHGLDSNNSTDAGLDPDSDNLTNLMEFENGTDPNEPDTDGGGVDDDVEITQGYDPTNPEDDEYIDSDNDKIPDIIDPEPGKPTQEPAESESDESIGLGVSFCFLIFVVPGIVLLLVIIFVYTKMRRDRLLDHDTRNRIYEYINRNPGTHYRAVMNDLGLHMGTLTHHVNMLEQQRYIKSYQDGMYRRFYPIDTKIETGLILSDIQKKILRTIQGNPGISQTGIAKNLGQTRKIVHYHIKLLADAGFVHVETVGRETNCHYIGGLDMDVNNGQKISPGAGKAG
jgi:predicted transcriptional regulator